MMSTLSPAKKPGDPLAPHRPLHEFYEAPMSRSGFVKELFDEAAPDYDWVSGVMSLWSDRPYRKHALQQAGLRPGMRLLDVASGTGLMVKAALELGLDPASVTGLDTSRGMLEQNRRRNPVALVQARAERLPLQDGAFDFVCMGYALRHVEDLREFFGELSRVLKPGGRLLLLEISRPTSPLAQRLMRLYMQKLLPLLGWVLRRNTSTTKLLEYYWATIKECVPPETILSALEAQGFLAVRRTTGGPILSEYTATR